MTIDPYNQYAAVTPSDSVNITVDAGNKTIVPQAFYIGVAGDVVAVKGDGTTATFKAVPVGVLPITAKRINATGTTATDILALWRV